MKRVININFQGRVVPIEELAYDILKNYVESLRIYFSNEEGKEEIINDIESRIAELFAEVLKKGKSCITDEDVNNIIGSMGRPEDFEGEDPKVNAQFEQNYQQEKASSSNGHKRLYRDENNKVLGGVCGGIANYFNIDPLIIRILGIVTLSFTFLPYIILWVAVPSTATQVIGSTRKRLFRDMDEKIIGGVASGLSHYFGINVWIPRIIFLIPFLSFITNWSHWGLFGFPHFISLSFSPGAAVIYLVLWIILPEAVSSADKLEMKGERVDLNTIKNTIQSDMEGFKGRAEKFGADLKNRAEIFGKEFSNKSKINTTDYTIKTPKTGLAHVLLFLIKAFIYLIIAIVLFAIVISMFAIGIVFTSMFPLFNFFFTDGAEVILIWASILLFIWTPVVGITTWIVRRVSRTKSNSGIIRYILLSLWFLGIFCMIALGVLIRKDFRYRNNPIEDKITLTNPTISNLNVVINGYEKNKQINNWLKIEPFEDFNGDTAYVPNTDIQIFQSKTDSFEVSVLKLSNGETKEIANSLAQKINYTITQKDSTLSLYKGIPINTFDKFRNQRVVITISVPIGKRIRIDDVIGWKNHVHVGGDDNDWDWLHEYFSRKGMNWEPNTEYIMTADGLKEMYKTKNSSIDLNNESDEMKEKMEENSQNREELRQEIEEKQKEIEEKKRELQKELEKE